MCVYAVFSIARDLRPNYCPNPAGYNALYAVLDIGLKIGR
jgi:hypothetical protein